MHPHIQAAKGLRQWLLPILLFFIVIPVFISAAGYEISNDRIYETIKMMDIKTLPVFINNTGSAQLRIGIKVDPNLSDVVMLDRGDLVIGSLKTENFTLTLLGLGNASRIGYVQLSGDIEKILPVNITTTQDDGQPKVALIVTLELYSPKVQPGKKLSIETTLQNPQEKNSYNVSLTFNLSYQNGSPVYIKGISNLSMSLILSSSRSIQNDLQIPANLKVGDYALTAEAEYFGLRSVQSTQFSVYEPFLARTIVGPLRVWHLLLFLGALMIGLYAYQAYKKNAASKKKYKSKLDFGKLPKPGARSGWIGKIADTNIKAYFDLDQLASHTLIAGSTGGGKTVSAKVLIEEALLKGASVFCFDPTAQWTGLLRKCTSKKMLDLYPLYNMKVTDARAFNGNVHQIMNAREIIEVKKYLKPGEAHIFSISRLDPEDIDILVANTIRGIFAANLPESNSLKLLIVFDEVHRLLPKFGGSGEGFIQIERAMREFRKFGVGLFLISQVLTDFVGETKANIATELQMRTRDQGDLDRIKSKYGSYMLQSLLKASTGTGMLENTEYNNGEPYFVSFRPLLHEHARLSDEELENYNKYNAIIDDLDYNIEQLDGYGIDSFDMKLELKMALDKVKSGSFNMANIYIESLSPRIKDQFKKLGKMPKKREIKLVSTDDLKKELEKAKAERESISSGQAGGKKEEPTGPPPLRLKNGIVVLSKEELNDALGTMDEATFAQHVTATQNLFYDWFAKFDAKTAERVKTVKTIAELAAAINFKEPEKKKK